MKKSKVTLSLNDTKRIIINLNFSIENIACCNDITITLVEGKKIITLTRVRS
jgi:uncharacterized protein YlzI (FlbEa/FlbD family)